MQNEKDSEYYDQNDLTIAPGDQFEKKSSCIENLEKISTLHTEKDIEHGEHMDRIETSKQPLVDDPLINH